MDRTTTYPTPGATLRKYFRCRHCDEPFLTRRAVAGHERKEHGQMDVKHTPAPWTQFDDGGQSEVLDRIVGPVKNVSSHITATVARASFGIRSNEEVAANARLIAAAPELLAALQGWQELRDSDAADARDAVEWIERVERQMRNAIAKAQGGAS